MWTELAKTFDDFLFSKRYVAILDSKDFNFENSSVPPTDIPTEELQRDEAIDCQVYFNLQLNIFIFFFLIF
jgi:hypothetical protein